MESLRNGSLCDGNLNKRLLESNHYNSCGVLIKKRKVFATRDFPPGCGLGAPCVSLLAQGSKPLASLGDKKKFGADEKTMNVALAVSGKASEVGNVAVSHHLVRSLVKLELTGSFDDLVEKVVQDTWVNGVELPNNLQPLGSSLQKVPENYALELSEEFPEVDNKAIMKSEDALENQTMLEISPLADRMAPRGVAKEWSLPQLPIGTTKILKESVLENRYPRRKVPVIRDFPPFCGQNIPCLTEEELLSVISSNKNSGVSDSLLQKEATKRGYLPRETARTCIEKVNGDALNGFSKKRKLEGGGTVSELKTKSLRPPMKGWSLMETVRDDVKTSPVRGRASAAMKKTLLYSGEASNANKGAQVVKCRGDFTVEEQYENSPAGQRSHDFGVILPPFGPSNSGHGDMRNKVRETLRLFQAICRKLLQGEEAKLRKQGDLRRRIDLEAAEIIKLKGKEVITDKQRIGSVPGVEVGDEFIYRVELALVGIHRLYQGGIDYTKQGRIIIATSIVASGSYADDLDNADVLIYSGQGGNIVGKNKEPKDQKLERGNLALKNSISAKNPVRVVRGYKETKASAMHSRGKIATIYTYDGLYTVTRYWHAVGPHGKLVYMFELRRIPGQPELAWKEVKKKLKLREGLCNDDISGGKELFRISAVNTFDDEKPPKFYYITQMKYPDWFNPTPPKGCDCVGKCLDSKKCLCVAKNGGEFPYNYDGAIVETKPLVYECGPSCKCPPSCYNRVSQHGIKIQLESFKTESRGWGVRSLTSIPSGTFICEYVGELLEDKEAEQRKNDEYLFDIGQNYSDCSVGGGLSILKPNTQIHSDNAREDGGFTIDAAQCGNVGRLINHSCSPNLYAQNVLYDHEDKRMPHIMLFAAENIPPLQELSYHYNYAVNQIQDSNGKIKMKSCYCGSEVCTGRMY